MSRRNSSIELYRVLLMLGIVGLHCHVILKPFGRGLDNILATCVVGFVFISGYFGIRLSRKKVARILSIGLYCALIATVLHCAILSGFTLKGFAYIYWWTLKCFWFLWAYIALMMIAPVVEKLFTEESVRFLNIAPIVLLVFGWSYLTMFPKIGELFPSVVGFGPTGVLTLLAIYVVARFIRQIETGRLKWLLERRWLVLIVVVSATFCWIGFYHYNSPFALALAFSTFMLFKGMHIPVWLGNTVNTIGPSMFSVYLLHTSGIGYRLIEKMGQFCQWRISCYILSVIVVFTSCIILDLPRRWIDGKIK